MPLNAFGLWERGEEDGHCLVPLASMMNHSCVPNCRYQVENGAISFYALRDIEVDEELTFSYIDDSSMSTAERKRFIRTSWDFECRCLRCTADGADAAPKGARMTTRTLWAVGTVRTVVDAAVEVNACQVSHIAAVLNSCAQMQWRDDHLLCGLTEALRCAAELRRGTVRDYAVCLQSLRRLNYCPWVGALRPLIRALRWRLRKHHWRPLDLVLTLRFAAEFSIQQVPQVRAEGLALCRELQMRAEKRMGDMRHLELAHLARALVLLNQSGLPDTLLLERVADNFSRRAGDLPLGALLHMCNSLLTAKAEAPSEFRQVLVEKEVELWNKRK
ncbi:Histone-lysine N-methyltransferase SMYD3 (SET and MYND domain-containing protein 3) (Zinc finger MYND domain-containing protein 1) [Durusdinium trenchii]|uniref:Histone-lysine N-methyltransferase SMYD3 (SET and MYND domain-containing protein 3) (Zinc finger MYND domain-containing protein 1) n=1 Tax=Durusdinium trenchii TaxID=1381693 RepID=A0ABP0KTK9_9DINO